MIFLSLMVFFQKQEMKADIHLESCLLLYEVSQRSAGETSVSLKTTVKGKTLEAIQNSRSTQVTGGEKKYVVELQSFTQ